jgi:tetratricopeptide (TPR) repeat protein
LPTAKYVFMKKRIIYISVLFFFITASGFIILKYKTEAGKKASSLCELLPRKGNFSKDAEWLSAKKISAGLMQKIKANPSDKKSLNGLAAIYLEEARATGNFSYYDQAALNCVNRVLALDARDFEGLTYKATIFLSQHHFADGLALAKEILQFYPYSAHVYGILVDANVEMGNYKEAVDAAEKMISIRPDIRSYSRISYLREIHGDIPGAIDAMKLAVDAGSPGAEATEWSRVQLGKLYEQTGEISYAEMTYSIALQNRPDYPYALGGLARLATAAGNYSKAIELYTRAIAISNDYSFREALAETCKLNGQNSKATAIGNEIVDEMAKASALSLKDPAAGHYADREMAYAYLAVGNYEKAIEHALLEYNRRPGNIDANETVAWVNYKLGNSRKAIDYIGAALKTNCRNPVLLCHAGLIYWKAGDSINGKKYLQEGLSDHPCMSVELQREAANALKVLN